MSTDPNGIEAAKPRSLFDVNLDSRQDKKFREWWVLCDVWFKFVEWTLMQGAINYASEKVAGAMAKALYCVYLLGFAFQINFIIAMTTRYKIVPAFITNRGIRAIVTFFIAAIPTWVLWFLIDAVVRSMKP